MRATVAVVLACWVSVAGAALNPPSPSTTKASEPQQTNASNADGKGGDKTKEADKPPPALINVYASPVAQNTGSDQGGQGHEESAWKGVWEALIAIGTIVLAVLTGILAWFTKGLLNEARNQFPHFLRNVDAGAKAADSANTNATALMLAERAYVKMSHRSPGVIFLDAPTTEDGGRVMARIGFQIDNWGRTPARVERTYARILSVHPDEKPPSSPEYRQGTQEMYAGVFLVSAENFTNVIESPIPGGAYTKLKSGKFNLYVIGYVDYSDIFHKHHRAGYARKYEPEIDEKAMKAGLWDDRNNLVFVNFPGYNYDRERSQDGNDQRDEKPPT